MFDRFKGQDIISYPLRPVFSCVAGAFLASLILFFTLDLFYTALLLIVFAIFAKKIFPEDFSKFIITLITVLFHGTYFLYNQNKYSELPDNFSVVAKVEIREFATPGEIDWLKMPYYTNAELMELRFSEYDRDPINVNMPVVVVFKNRDLKFSYGDILELRGRASRPSDILFEGDFNQRSFFLSRKTSFILYADDVKILRSKTCFTRTFLDKRNRILSKICKGLEEENRNILAALLFGCRQGIDSLSKQKLILGGTIHVIAISGIHTAVFASIFLFLMFFVPFQMRYFLLPFFVFFYVYCTGFQASALRAFLMIAIWSFGRSFLYPISPYSSLLYAGVVSLCLNPFSLLDPGFQYSFTITAFLIGAWKKAFSFISLFTLKNYFEIGVIRFVYFKKILNGILVSLIMCIIALLAGLQISLFNQNIFNLFSVFVNLIITPFLYLIFMFSFLKLLFSFNFLTLVFNSLLFLFRNLAIFFSDSAVRIATPPLFFLLFFFSLPLIILVFFNPSKKLCRIMYIFLFVAICVFFSLPMIRGNKMFLMSGEGLPPVIVALYPKQDTVVVVNTPSREHSKKIIELLSANGYNRIDKLYCTKALMKNIEGAPYLFSHFDCSNLIFLSNPSLSPYARNAMEFAVKNNVKIDLLSEENNLNKKRNMNESKINLKMPSGEIISIHYLRNGNTVIKIQSENRFKFRQIEIPNTLKMRIQEIK